MTKRCGPRKGVLLRLPVPLYAQAKERATGWHNSLNDQLVHLIRRGLEAEANRGEPGRRAAER